MATLIRRSEALKRIENLQEQAAEIGDEKGGKWLTRVYNALMSCKVQERIFCAQCGKPMKAEKIPELPGKNRQ